MFTSTVLELTACPSTGGGKLCSSQGVLSVAAVLGWTSPREAAMQIEGDSRNAPFVAAKLPVFGLHFTAECLLEEDHVTPRRCSALGAK